MMERHRFDVFGRVYDIEHVAGSWKTYAVGNDGKRGPGGFVVPDEVTAEELEQFLFDLFHEEAMPGKEIRRVGV